VLGIGIASATERFGALYLRRAVAARRMRNLAIELDQLGIINISTKTGLNGFDAGAIAVTGNLDPACETLGEITNKLSGRFPAPITDPPRRNQLRIGA
jgi:hypothetical protein